MGAGNENAHDAENMERFPAFEGAILVRASNPGSQF